MSTRSPASRRLDRADALTIALLAGATLMTAAVYQRLPAEVPVHFDIHARPDGWLPRAVGAWMGLGFAFGLAALLRFGSRLMPPAWRERMRASPMRAVTALTTALLVMLQMIILHASLHPDAALAPVLFGSLGLFWLLLAQLLPRVRRNPFVGIRTTWTITSDENWARTHRFAGYVMSAGGLVAVIAAFSSAPAVAVVAILVSALVPVVYSYVLARRLPS